VAAVELRRDLEHIEFIVQHLVGGTLPVVEVAGDDQRRTRRTWNARSRRETPPAGRRLLLIRAEVRVDSGGCRAVRCAFDVRHGVQQSPLLQRGVGDVVVQEHADPVADTIALPLVSVRIHGVHAVGAVQVAPVHRYPSWVLPVALALAMRSLRSCTSCRNTMWASIASTRAARRGCGPSAAVPSRLVDVVGGDASFMEPCSDPRRDAARSRKRGGSGRRSGAVRRNAVA